MANVGEQEIRSDSIVKGRVCDGESAVKEKVHELYNLLIAHTKEEQATSWLDITVVCCKFTIDTNLLRRFW